MKRKNIVGKLGRGGGRGVRGHTPHGTLTHATTFHIQTICPPWVKFLHETLSKTMPSFPQLAQRSKHSLYSIDHARTGTYKATYSARLRVEHSWVYHSCPHCEWQIDVHLHICTHTHTHTHTEILLTMSLMRVFLRSWRNTITWPHCMYLIPTLFQYFFIIVPSNRT